MKNKNIVDLVEDKDNNEGVSDMVGSELVGEADGEISDMVGSDVVEEIKPTSNIKQIGTKVYYSNPTGNVIKIIGDMMGFVKETTFEQDYKIYKELNEMEVETIGLIELEYGEYSKLSANSTGVSVNLETKELQFTYEPLPEIPQEPTEMENLQSEVVTLKDTVEQVKQENADLHFELMSNNII